MKWFLISLALGLAASDKLDRTYLPPPGAQFSGGILGHHDAPLKPPHHTGQGPEVGGHQGTQPGFGINGEPVNFGDKIPKVPVTTTSYAFSQTTTYPPGEGFETTVLPINPVTGLPIIPVTGLPTLLGQENFPNGPIQGQAPNFGTNIQTGYGLEGPTSAPVNKGSASFEQFANQPLNQYQGQNVILPGGGSQIPVTGHQDQYPGLNTVNPGGVVQISGGNQDLAQYPGGQAVTGQQGFLPSTGSPTNLQPGGNQYGVNYDGSQGNGSQGPYTGQPTNVSNLGGTQPTQTSFQNQEPIYNGRNPSQYPNENQNYGSLVPNGSGNIYQPGSSPSTTPTSYNNGIPSTTPLPGVPSLTSSYYSTVPPVYRPERPQAAADRNAVILNYENVRTPNGYSYSFDTSNGIHADESGIVDNGTKAQGSYSYVGDDGKVYSVIYTADENGFQPRGDHLPTPPPIPEAIQRVIDQAARDKAAGILHDGSYDEAKYGDKLYQETENSRRPQNKVINQFGNGLFNERKDGVIKPIVGIKDAEFDEGSQDHFSNDFPVTETTKDTNGKLPARRPPNQINGNISNDISDGTRKVVGDFDSPKGTFDRNDMPIAEDEIKQQKTFGTMKQGSAGRPVLNGYNLPTNENNDSNQNDLYGSKNREFSSRRPLSGGVKDATEKYPGSNVDVGATDYLGTGGDGFGNNKGQNIGSGSPSIISDDSDENMNINFDSVTGAPTAGNKNQVLRQRIKESRRPGLTGNRYNQNKNGRPQSETTKSPSFGEYVKNGIENQQTIQHDDTGYHYQQPNNNRFEQNTFPTRFSPQEVSSNSKPDQRRTDFEKGTTLRPFMTPNVYNKNDRDGQTTPNGYNPNNRNSQSTTRRPFTTVGVTSPSDNSYTDYDDGDDYTPDQNFGDEGINSNRYPTEKDSVTSRPYQSTQTTSRPHNVPGGQRTRVSHKGTVTPGQRTESSGTVSPGYTYRTTTQMPTHSSRFGNTESPRTKPQQHSPSITVPYSTTAVGNPITRLPSKTRPADYKYQTTGPNSKYSGTNVGSGYPITGSFPGSGSESTTPGVSTPQDYYTTTYGPIQGFTSTTAIPPTYGYTQGSGSKIPSNTPGSFRPSQDQYFQTGYHYGPPKSGSINLDGPGFLTPTKNTGVFPTSPTETYQTSYQQNQDGFPSTTLGPVTSGGQGTFIPFQPGTVAPGTSPFGTYQENYQNGPSTPDYPNNVVSSTPGGKPIFKYPGSSGGQKTTGFEYGPSQPNYSTTDTPSTFGTTPGSFIPSATTEPSQGYSTTYRPGFQTTKNTFESGPVDGFGRPITPEQGGFHPGSSHPTHGTTGPSFGGTDQSNTYPGSYDQNRVIGEDFSGPKQPQRFDPKTGYHYK